MYRLSPRALIRRILYSTSYTVLLIAALMLLVVTPGDHIYQTLSNAKIGNIFVVGGTYSVTALVALFIYASRLYTNRTTLAAIPKPYLPIESGEVSSLIRKIIVRNLTRSALIAWDSRPRDLRNELPIKDREEDEKHQHGKQKPGDSGPLRRINSRRDRNRNGNHVLIPVDSGDPPWGTVVHPGWSAPTTSDFSNLQFATVIVELPNLIEAKAVSLASREEKHPDDGMGAGAVLDPKTVALLQRNPSTGLRKYLHQLDVVGVIKSRELQNSFLDLYEYARFSGNVVTEEEFRELMSIFSLLIEGMDHLESETIAAAVSSAEERAPISLEYGLHSNSDSILADVPDQVSFSPVTRAHFEQQTAILQEDTARSNSPSLSSSSIASVVIHR